MNKESEGFFYVRKANFPTHGIVAGEEFPHHVGRDDEVRKRTLKNALHSSTRRAVAGTAVIVICIMVRGCTNPCMDYNNCIMVRENINPYTYKIR